MSNKASRLGKGTSFTQTQNVSARRQAIDAATSAPTEGALPPVKLLVSLISLNPANPRTTLGDLRDLAASLRDHGQKQAITIMSRFSYLEANPDRAEDLEEGTEYVVIDGNSRLAAAREAGLSDIKVMLDEDLGNTADEILESSLVANIHRQDLEPLDEARVLQQLLQSAGTQEALAARLHRSQGWVSQRLALLGLTPELQSKLVAGEEPAELLRRVGNKKPEEQAAHLELLKKQKAAAKKRVPAPTRPEPAPSAAGHAPESPAAGNPDQSHYAVMKTADPKPIDAGSGTDGVPAARGPVPMPAPVKMPWADGAAAMDIAFSKLTQHNQRDRAIARYIELVGGAEDFAEELRANTSPEYRQQLAELLA
ncbi:ParB/RepB/Spo0J family partition protein [Streptomyces virginiae]|uniref:ParB/RepB/Spo0J family partition protein n=1 Tax=Streptomyces virginiae TaxID=1961 RepID=UPI002254948E|nr:ParB/RepB/Spo0J family partition protein [Streptomyces virginiae]MCX4721996.1 ParB/RepB/Spo0J family partition protein [Streptomyces virginiae]